jgi:hypothetical protein
MSISEHYRSTTDQKEILRILQKSSTSSENILWQPNGEKKNIIPIQCFEIDFVSREVVVFFDRSRFIFSSHLPVYLKLDHRTSVFKVAEIRQAADSISFPFPKNLKTLELRGLPRKVFSQDEDKTVTLIAKNLKGHELHVRLRDFSPSGLGLIFSEQNRPFLKSNPILWVTKLGEARLETPIKAEIQYINQEQFSRSQKKRQKELKVGLKLFEFIPDFALEKIVH